MMQKAFEAKRAIYRSQQTEVDAFLEAHATDMDQIDVLVFKRIYSEMILPTFFLYEKDVIGALTMARKEILAEIQHGTMLAHEAKMVLWKFFFYDTYSRYPWVPESVFKCVVCEHKKKQEAKELEQEEEKQRNDRKSFWNSMKLKT